MSGKGNVLTNSFAIFGVKFGSLIKGLEEVWERDLLLYVSYKEKLAPFPALVISQGPYPLDRFAVT